LETALLIKGLLDLDVERRLDANQALKSVKIIRKKLKNPESFETGAFTG